MMASQESGLRVSIRELSAIRAACLTYPLSWVINPSEILQSLRSFRDSRGLIP